MNWLSWLQDKSFVNNLMFPAPEPTYDERSLSDHLIYVPKRLSDPMLKDRLLDTEVIPCTFFQRDRDVQLLTILLHGNASDLGACKESAEWMGKYLQSHMLCPEYPGYGIYPGEPTEESLNASFEAVYNWVINPNGLNWPTNQLIILGRSIGTGPATHVCQQNIRITPKKRGEGKVRTIKTERMSTSALQCYLKAEDIDFRDQASRKELVSLASYHNINVGVDFTEDPFILVKRAALLTMLEKENIKIPKGTPSKVKLIELARSNNLIPSKHDWGGPLDRPKAALLVLLSGFGSIRHVVKSIIGDLASKMILNRFNNMKKIINVTCPVLIIHGRRDELIPVNHAHQIYKQCRNHRIKSKLVIHNEMTHNELIIKEHLTRPILRFITQLGLVLNTIKLKIPDYVRREPDHSDTIDRPEDFGESLRNEEEEPGTAGAENSEDNSDELTVEDIKLQLED